MDLVVIVGGVGCVVGADLEDVVWTHKGASVMAVLPIPKVSDLRIWGAVADGDLVLFRRDVNGVLYFQSGGASSGYSGITGATGAAGVGPQGPAGAAGATGAGGPTGPQAQTRLSPKGPAGPTGFAPGHS